MKQYVVDQLSESDYLKLSDYLEEHLECTFVEGIYWMDLPEALYSELQHQHKECQPFYFAVNLSRKQIGLEWLIRSRQTLHCSCIAYATTTQREYIIDFAEKTFAKLGIRA